MAKPQPLSCQEIVELVTDYIEGALSRRDTKRFEDHMAGCDGCRTYLAQMRTTIIRMGRLTEETIAPAARDTFLEVFRDWRTA